MAHHRKEHAVYADAGLDNVGRVAFVGLRVEVLDALARKFLVLREVEVGTRVYAFHLFETEGHAELDVGCGVGIVRQLFVVVETIVLSTKSQCLMPFHTRFFPLVEPI